MRKTTRIGIGAAAVLALSVGTFGAASALWNTTVGASVPEFPTGSVSFAAQAGSPDAVKVRSEDGAPVTVTLPGSTVIKVLEQDAVDAEPVIWRFAASGTALGIAGLDYTVSVREQTSNGTTHDLGPGHAQKGTVLEGSTLKVYRAAAGGDCSAVPATPKAKKSEKPRNVHLYEADGVQLQAPGTALGGRVSEQLWCAALNWNSALDGLYVNDAQATGTSEDGGSNGARASWHAPVGFPPSLDVLGSYRDLGLVEGTAMDGTSSKSDAEWHAEIYPDPAGEPDIVIALDPVVTNLNPAQDARD